MLRQQFANDLACLPVQQRAVSGSPTEHDSIRVESEELEQGGVVVVMVDDVFHRVVP